MTDDLKSALLNIERFSPDGAAGDLIEDLDSAVGEINSSRPLADVVVTSLQEQTLYDRVHSSAVTEGNRLSRRETIVVLTSGLVEAGARKDEIEVHNLARAIISTEERLKSGEPLDPQFIRQVHALLLEGLDDSSAGRFRTENVAISGAVMNPPHFHDVLDLVSELTDFSRTDAVKYHPIQHAAWLHWALARIHPFKDGNGRIARIGQDFVLLNYRYVPAPLRSEDREGAYYDALSDADTGNGRALLELVAKNAVRMADRYLSIIREEKEKKTWLKMMTLAATERVNQTAFRRFHLVQRASSSLKTEFFNTAKELDNEYRRLGVGSIRVRDYGILDSEKFSKLEAAGRAERSWFFGVEFAIQQTRQRYLFWYGTHHVQPGDEAEITSKVAILISREESTDEGPYYRLLREIEEDRVTIREIIPTGSSFMRIRYNPILRKEEWDHDLSVGVLVRNFFEEVLSTFGVI